MDDEASLQSTIARARDFDPDAWEALYRRLHPGLHAYARRRLAAPMCDDAVSETFTRAMEAIGRFSRRSGSFDGWVFGILRNVVLESYRKAGRHDHEVPDLASEEEDPLDRLVAGERAAEVRAAFEQLAPDDREVLELRVLGRLDAEAVGAVVGKRAGAVRMAQARALSRLGDLLGERQR